MAETKRKEAGTKRKAGVSKTAEKTRKPRATRVDSIPAEGGAVKGKDNNPASDYVAGGKWDKKTAKLIKGFEEVINRNGFERYILGDKGYGDHILAEVAADTVKLFIYKAAKKAKTRGYSETALQEIGLILACLAERETERKSEKS